MKRDLNLIRDILLAIEAEPSGGLIRLVDLPGWPRAAVHFHAHLLIEAGLVATPLPMRGPDRPWIALNLTWRGYDFLDGVRDPRAWRATKRMAGRLGSWSLETVGAIAKAGLLAKANELGLSLPG